MTKKSAGGIVVTGKTRCSQVLRTRSPTAISLQRSDHFAIKSLIDFVYKHYFVVVFYRGSRDDKCKILLLVTIKVKKEQLMQSFL